MQDFDRLNRIAKRLQERYPRGTRIVLLSIGNDPNPILPGTRGTVNVVDDIATVHCTFDNGRSLGCLRQEIVDCAVFGVHWIIRCTRGQKAIRAYSTG